MSNLPILVQETAKTNQNKSIPERKSRLVTYFCNQLIHLSGIQYLSVTICNDRIMELSL